MDSKFYQSVKDELFNDILPYWEKHARDTVNPGFYGDIDNYNNPNPDCERSIVMTSRFLWTYSAATRLTKNPEYLKMADFAYDVIVNKYFDKDNDGVFWSVLPDGTPKIDKKQIYGEAFCCYGLSEYAAALKELSDGQRSLADQRSTGEDARSLRLSKDQLAENAMNHALDLYYLLEKYAYDPEAGGYVEARARDWSKTDDMQLSSKDMNCPKSMNTNLHVMEAYTNLYRTLPVVFPDAGSIRAEVRDSLANLVRTTVHSILQPNAHLGMFFDMNWKLLSDEISYGHDIEASWLLWEAACELADSELQSEIHDTVLRIAEVSLKEGFDHENGCLENFLSDGGSHRDRRRVWWNQAESMNGFYNAWEMTGERKYEEACEKQWSWILNHQTDRNGGDWWAELDVNGVPILKESKGGNWKTSYHNGRTCMEILKRKNLKKM